MRSDAPVQLSWLVRLRWAAIGAQVASIAGTRWLLRAPFPLAPLGLIVGALVAANVALTLRLRRGTALSEGAIAGNLLLDCAGLTGLLIWTGGAMNPFTTLYLLQVVLAAILVPGRWSLAVTLGAVLSFGGLLLARPEAIHVWHSAGMFELHVRGMWLAFALTAGDADADLVKQRFRPGQCRRHPGGVARPEGVVGTVAVADQGLPGGLEVAQ